MLIVDASRLGRDGFSCDQLRNEALVSLLVTFRASFNRRMCGSAGSCTVVGLFGLSPFFVLVPVGLMVFVCRAGASMTFLQIRVRHSGPSDGCVRLNSGSAYSQ